MNKKKYLNSFLFTSNMDVSYTLSITNLVKEDSGRFTCQHFDQNLMKYFDLVVLGWRFIVFHVFIGIIGHVEYEFLFQNLTL